MDMGRASAKSDAQPISFQMHQATADLAMYGNGQR